MSAGSQQAKSRQLLLPSRDHGNDAVPIIPCKGRRQASLGAKRSIVVPRDPENCVSRKMRTGTSEPDKTLVPCFSVNMPMNVCLNEGNEFPGISEDSKVSIGSTSTSLVRL